MRPGQAKGPFLGSIGFTPPPTPTVTPTWFCTAITHTQLQAAALTNTITVYTLPIRGVVEAVVVEPTTVFIGTGITSYKVAVGLAGEHDRYTSWFDVDTVLSATQFQIANVLDAQSTGGTTAVTISALSVGANLNQSTSGVLQVCLLLSTWR